MATVNPSRTVRSTSANPTSALLVGLRRARRSRRSPNPPVISSRTAGPLPTTTCTFRRQCRTNEASNSTPSFGKLGMRSSLIRRDRRGIWSRFRKRSASGEIQTCVPSKHAKSRDRERGNRRTSGNEQPNSIRSTWDGVRNPHPTSIVVDILAPHEQCIENSTDATAMAGRS